MEGLRKPERFVPALRQCAAAGKSVIIVKAGRASRGTESVAAHTASFAGSYEVFRAACEEAGARVTDDPIHMIALAEALAVSGKTSPYFGEGLPVPLSGVEPAGAGAPHVQNRGVDAGGVGGRDQLGQTHSGACPGADHSVRPDQITCWKRCRPRSRRTSRPLRRWNGIACPDAVHVCRGKLLNL